jgi:hypothetical protein
VVSVVVSAVMPPVTVAVPSDLHRSELLALFGGEDLPDLAKSADAQVDHLRHQSLDFPRLGHDGRLVAREGEPAKFLTGLPELLRELPALLGLALADIADGLHLIVAGAEPFLESALHPAMRAATSLDNIGPDREKSYAEQQHRNPSSVPIHAGIPFPVPFESLTGLTTRLGSGLTAEDPKAARASRQRLSVRRPLGEGLLEDLVNRAGRFRASAATADLDPLAGPADLEGLPRPPGPGTRPPLLAGPGTFTLDTAQPLALRLKLLSHRFGVRIERERRLPGGDRVLCEPILQEDVAEMIEDHRILGLVDRAPELAQRLRIAALLVEGPSEAVDKVTVVRLEVERLSDQCDRLVQVDPLSTNM